MKKIWYLFFILFIISILFVLRDWNAGSFDFFKFQEQHFYFQSWISFAGILFSTIMAITTFIIYKKSQLKSLKYISISFSLIATAYAIIGYHGSYCKACSDLEYCAASHNYPNYMIIITMIIFVLSTIILSRNIDKIKKAQLLQKFSYGLMVSTIMLVIILFISLKYLEIPDEVLYFLSVNLEGFVFISPLIIILYAFVYFRRVYKVSGIYLVIALLLSLSLVPQIFHLLTCKDCHMMACSEFYVFSGFTIMIAVVTFIHAINIQLEENRE